MNKFHATVEVSLSLPWAIKTCFTTKPGSDAERQSAADIARVTMEFYFAVMNYRDSVGSSVTGRCLIN